MLDFFKSSKNNFIGIDFGTSAIKLVELSMNNQKIHLVNYAWVNFSEAVGDNGNVIFAGTEVEAGKYLKKILEKMKTKTSSVYVAMPALYGLITTIEFPEMEKEDLDQAIKLDAYKYIPSNLDEVYLSWDVIYKEKKNKLSNNENSEKKEKNSNKVKVLLVAAPKKEVNRYEKILQHAEMETQSLELDTFSTARSLVKEKTGVFLIIEIGAKTSNIILVDNGNVIISRNLDVGGNEITRVIASSMNIAWKRAEQFKKKGKNFFEEKESIAVTTTLELIAKEASRVIDNYLEGDFNKKIQKVILSGGAAKLNGIGKFFSNYLKTDCLIGNPWERIIVDKKIEPFVNEMGTSFSVPIGAALKGIDEYMRGKG